MPGIVRFVKLACGKHWGHPDRHAPGGRCRKCPVYRTGPHVPLGPVVARRDKDGKFPRPFEQFNEGDNQS